MKMKPAKVTIDLDDYESSDNQIVPDSGDFRLERRWKRRELSNTREKHNHHDGSTRSTINNCGNVSVLSLQEDHMSEDEPDEDYKLFLLKYNYEDIDVVSDDNADDSDNDINIVYNSIHYDSQCMMFLEEERFHNHPKLNTWMMKGSKQRYETRKNGNKGSNPVRKQLSDPIKSQMNLEAKRRLSKKRPREDVSVVTGNHCYTEMQGSKQRYETENPAYKGSDSVPKQTSRSLKSCQNLEAKRGHSKKRPHENLCGVDQNSCHNEMMKGRKQSCESGKGSNSVRKQTRVTRTSQQNLEARRGLSKKRPYEDVSVVPENNCYSNTELDVVDDDYQTFLNSLIEDYVPSELLRKSSSVMGNSQVSDHVLSEADEDYLRYLNSLSIEDEVECMPERNTSKADMPKRKYSNTDMPEKNTLMTDMPKRNTTKTDMPKRNTTKTDMPEKNTLKTEMPQRNTIKTDMPKRNTTKTDMPPEKNTLKIEMPQRNTIKTDMPKRNTTKTDMPRKNTLKTDMPQRNTLETDMPKWNTSETSKTDMPTRNTTKIDMPEKNTSKRDMPKRKTLETGMPKWNTIKTDMGMRKTLESGMLDRNTFKTDMPERNALHAHMPERNISDTVNVHDDSNSSEPDVILLEPDQIQENTPFVSSETYDLSWFGTEVNLKHMPQRNISNTVNVDGDSNSSEPDQIKENTPFVSSKTYDSSWFGTEVNLKHMPERNISNTVNVDGDSNSSEPDVILLEPDQIQENTPFVSSKTYDSSWFGTGVNLKDNWQLSAYDHSQFRKRLMNDLQRPFDKEEYDRLFLEVRQKRKTERHIETRQGVVKAYCTQGVNKSYLELYPDLAKAMANFKKPETDLFILRGFIFWLQNLTHEGRFKPWNDIKCLEILSKM